MNAMLFIQSLTRLSTEDQTSLPYYFAQLPLDEKLMIEENKTALVKSYRPKAEELKILPTVFYYSVWLIAIYEYRSRQKKKPLPAELERIEEMRIRKIRNDLERRKAPLHKFIERHLPTIEKLRKEGLGWRQIAKYLQVYYRKEISFSYLRASYHELMKNFR